LGSSRQAGFLASVILSALRLFFFYVVLAFMPAVAFLLRSVRSRRLPPAGGRQSVLGLFPISDLAAFVTSLSSGGVRRLRAEGPQPIRPARSTRRTRAAHKHPSRPQENPHANSIQSSNEESPALPLRQQHRRTSSNPQGLRRIPFIHANLQIPARSDKRNRFACIPIRKRWHQPRNRVASHL
jgi:hypothetical protein